MTREAGTRYPQLFAALSPWNAPPAETWPGFAEGGWQMPCFIYLGDNDPVARGTEEPLLEQMLRANCCAAVRTAGGFVPDAIYNGENHYTAARLSSWIAPWGIFFITVTHTRGTPCASR